MTVEEYVEYAMGIRQQLFQVCRDSLPIETKIIQRYILSGQTDDASWLAPLKNQDGKIQCLAILTNSLPIGSLSKTAGGNVIHSQLKFKLELFHEYLPGIDANNSEDKFIADGLRLQYTIGKNRSFGNYAVIENRVDFQLGISKGTFPCHKGMADLMIDLRNVRY